MIATPSFANPSQQGLTDAGTLRQEDVAHDAPDYSPFVDRHVPDKVLWGDTHLHTSYSVDAGFFGNTLDPEAAFRFARGEHVYKLANLERTFIVGEPLIPGKHTIRYEFEYDGGSGFGNGGDGTLFVDGKKVAEG